MRATALSVLILMSGSMVMAQPVPQAQDGELAPRPQLAQQPPPRQLAQAPAPAPVVELQTAPVLVPCDEPSAACGQVPAPYVIAAPPARAPWQLHVSLSVTSGVVSAVSLMGGELGPGAYIGGDLRLLWSRLGKRWGVGLRFSGTKSLVIKNAQSSSDRRGEASGADVGFLLDVYNFWFSTGLGFAFYSGGRDVSYLPEVFLSLGYDIPLGRYLALRLSASVSTLIVTARAQAGGGLVVRF